MASIFGAVQETSKTHLSRLALHKLFYGYFIDHRRALLLFVKLPCDCYCNLLHENPDISIALYYKLAPSIYRIVDKIEQFQRLNLMWTYNIIDVIHRVIYILKFMILHIRFGRTAFALIPFSRGLPGHMHAVQKLRGVHRCSSKVYRSQCCLCIRTTEPGSGDEIRSCLNKHNMQWWIKLLLRSWEWYYSSR